MGRKSKTQQLTESILGQHIALCVAAGLARSQLVADPLVVYDAEHLSAMLDVIARALARVAPLFVRDGAEDPRPLSIAELGEAAIRRGATIVELTDGRCYSSVTMRRGDLRQAIAILKAVGVPEIAATLRAREPAAPAPASDWRCDLLAVLDEIDTLARPPLVQVRLEQANRLALSIARKAPQGRIANLAMQLMSAALEARSAAELPESFKMIAARLRVALEGNATNP